MSGRALRIGFLVLNLDGMGGTSRSVITQANALAAHPDGHDVRLLSVTRTAETPHYDIDARIAVEHLVDLRDPEQPRCEGVDDAVAAAAHARQSSLVPARWDGQFTGLCDLALEQRLPRLADGPGLDGPGLDVLVTVTPGLLVCGTTLAPDRVVVVHQEHRSSNDRTSGREPLLAFAPRADVVALLTPTIDAWLHEQLGELTPPTVVVPNPLPLGFTPRSSLESQVIMAAGRLVAEKQLVKLVEAFAQVADALPGWRLRICGDGPARGEIARHVRKRDLWDRVELTGSLPDLAAEWPRASIAALSSRAEGYPLVLQEAMAAGVPAVSFDCPSGPREIIDHEVDGLLVAPQSVGGLAAALLRVASDDQLRHRLGAGALRTARAWDAGAIADRWVAIFRDALDRRGGRGRLTARIAARIAAPVATAVVDPAADPAVAAAQRGVTPAEARRHALETCVAAARAAVTPTDADPHPWLVVPAHEHARPTLVLPITHRTRFLDALADAAGAPYLSLRDPALHGWHERRGPVAAMAAELRRGMTTTLHVEPWPRVDGRASLLGEGCGVRVQFWEVDGGDLVAPGPDPYATRITATARAAAVVAEVEGVPVPTLPLMAAPTVTEVRFPVDVVYTWVDGRDPDWDAARRARLAEVGGAAVAREASGPARFVDHGELRYSLRSLHLFAPWVRRIHLVTAGQHPDWLDVDHPRLHLVDHRDLLPSDALPTFNSHAIETALHRIDGLAEHFLYLNDDVLLARPLRAERFFGASGSTAVVPSTHTIGLPDDHGDPGAPPFLRAAWNNRELLRDAFGAVVTRQLAHVPHAHRVSVLEELHRRFPEALAATARTPFRSATDVSTLSSLAQHFGLLSGTAHLASLDLAYVDLSNADVERRLAAVGERSHDVICLADHHDHALRAERLELVLHDFLEGYYPVAAPWEREPPT